MVSVIGTKKRVRELIGKFRLEFRDLDQFERVLKHTKYAHTFKDSTLCVCCCRCNYYRFTEDYIYPSLNDLDGQSVPLEETMWFKELGELSGRQDARAEKLVEASVFRCVFVFVHYTSICMCTLIFHMCAVELGALSGHPRLIAIG